MSDEIRKRKLIDNPAFIHEFASRNPNLRDKNGNITITVWWGESITPKIMVSNAMPSVDFEDSKLSPVKSLRVSVGSYEDDSEQLLHYMHIKTEN
jgi:hypothetical protein